jgi:hypothetical protein
MERITVLIRNINRNEWREFQKLCIDEKTNCTAKIKRMIKKEVKDEIT